MCVVCSSDLERGIDNRAIRLAEDRRSSTNFRASQRNLAMLRDQKPKQSKIMQNKNVSCVCAVTSPILATTTQEQRRLCLSGELWRTSAQLTEGSTTERNQEEIQCPVLPFGIGSHHPLQKGTGEIELWDRQQGGLDID